MSAAKEIKYFLINNILHPSFLSWYIFTPKHFVCNWKVMKMFRSILKMVDESFFPVGINDFSAAFSFRRSLNGPPAL